ncbi:MAG: PQQ-dependent sugar dehydrogenase [Pseudomonadota bacterium]
MYHNNCASCHHANLQGTTPGTNLLAAQLKYGDDVNLLIESIERLPVHHQIEWSEEVTATTAKALALFISERRQAYPSIASSYEHQFLQKSVSSQYHRFSVEKFSALESRPYSIAPLPNGNIIVAEKVRGLSIVDENGAQGALINGAPTTHEQFLSVEGTYVGWGQLLEVALHPQYAENGWVYISFTDRCQLTCGSPVPKTMVKVIRGRIDDNEWVDQQVIWSVHQDYYTIVPDAVAGGRLGFDKQGHIFITIGGKANYKHLHNMDTPYGKVHRVRLDGSVPEDNPFWESADARAESSTRHTVWSYGHRTAQGLEGHPITGEIWESEMGPRGGDEVNKIVAGGNYGWPLYTNGLDYDSTEISIGEDLGLNFPIEDTVLPAVDFTPAPALSNLTFHNGDIFTQWESDILIGSLKALTLYRLRFKDDALVEKETLVTELGRIRDVEMGADGFVYIAIEHNDDGSIVRLVPE